MILLLSWKTTDKLDSLVAKALHADFTFLTILHSSSTGFTHQALQVTVCESHSIPGGAAHAWVQDGYHFESGPSLYSGMAGTGKEANPLAHVLQAIGEDLELIRYNTWNVIVPEGEFLTKVRTTGGNADGLAIPPLAGC